MKISRIIFLVQNTFSLRDFEAYGIESLMGKGFEVEVWDITSILFPSCVENYSRQELPRFSGLRAFVSKKKLLVDLGSLNHHDFVFIRLTFSIRAHYIYRQLTKKNICYGLLEGGFLPLNTINPDNIKLREKNIIRRIKNIFSLKIMDIFYVRFYRFFGIKSADLVLSASKKSSGYQRPQSQKSKLVLHHSLDYEHYLKVKGNLKKFGDNICVFLDEYIPFHLDYQYMKVDPPATPEVYYRSMRRFFDRLEKESGFEVVIAAHPKSHYDQHPGCFGDRRIIKHNTVYLVGVAKLIIAHASTSTTFANIFMKPIIFITTNQLIDSFYGAYIQNLSRFFGKTVMNIDEENSLDIPRELRLDEARYKTYRDDFLKYPLTEDISLWDVFVNALEGM